MEEYQFWQGTAGPTPSSAVATITIGLTSLGSEHADIIRAQQIFRGAILQKAWTSTREDEVRRVEEPGVLGDEVAKDYDWTCLIRSEDSTDTGRHSDDQ